MSIQAKDVENEKGAPLTSEQKHEQRQRLLTRSTPALVRSIADAIVVKNQDLFFLCAPDGNMPLEDNHGLGLYYHDCRYLNGYALQLNGGAPVTLVANAEPGFTAVFQLTNHDLTLANGQLIPKDSLGIEWQRTLDPQRLALDDLLTLHNYGTAPADFSLTLTFQAHFEDVFEVRGLLPKKVGRSGPPQWEKGNLRFTYAGADGLWRSLTIHFSQAPESEQSPTARFQFHLEPQAETTLLVSLLVAESVNAPEPPSRPRLYPNLAQVQALHERLTGEWLGQQTQVRSNSLLFDRLLDRSLRDLRALQSTLDKQMYFAAGVPWFATLFGRDSLITSLQMLAFETGIAAQTCRLLARYQGSQVDAWRDEQPGKILHEMRVGELARLHQVPYTPYYGSIDATLLFLILMGEYAGWTGDLTLFEELRENVERALEWMSRYGDIDGDGYIEYASASSHGLINQGWKDSGDAIVNADGSLASPPIALVEVQGYAYRAKLSIADLYARAGQTERAEQLRRDAAQLRARFNRDFWQEGENFFALALQAGRRPSTVISSNPGQALWTGIVDPDRARPVVERLMAEDMFSGWGIRTLSTRERRYNPVSYHLGTVWPHDNSIIAAGFKRYGFEDATLQIFNGIAQAAMRFPMFRLPELFAGFARQDYGVPVHYPVACHPQAWAAGTIPFLLSTLLGLKPQAFARRLDIVRPQLPEWVDRLEMRGLRVGQARLDLLFERKSERTVDVKVVKTEGRLDVIVEPEKPS